MQELTGWLTLARENYWENNPGDRRNAIDVGILPGNFQLMNKVDSNHKGHSFE